MVPFPIFWNAPFGPNVTSRRSGSSPTQQSTISAPSAAFAGVSAERPLCLATQFSALARLRLYTVTSCPPRVARCPAMGKPITPSPMNASLLTAPPLRVFLAKRARFADNYKVSTHRPEPFRVMSQDLTNAIRALAMDAVQAANSGHPGMPMGMAEIALALWGRHLRHNPANPNWADRDRFVLSNGHGSMLLYALLHLTGYDLPIEELKRFRQLHSKTPGHPEYGLAPGVETTTGPLGQGLANAVGMAIAERLLAAEFNRPGFDIVDHHTYVSVGDGCLMEGISHEACSLAGTLGLGKLIAIYDDNQISIDGEVKGWFRDDTPKRFDAYGWHVIARVDGHDVEAVDRALQAAKGVSGRPSLICCQTVIGKGAPKRAGTAKAHGEALGVEEVSATRKAIGWPHPPFVVPRHVYEGWDAKKRGAALEQAWIDKLAAYEKAYPAPARELRRRLAGELPQGWGERCRDLLGRIAAQAESIATRKASQNAIEGLAPILPEL